MKATLDYLSRPFKWVWDVGGGFGIVGAVMVAFLIGLMIAGVVSAAQPVSGTVVDKQFTPDNSGWRYGYSCNNGKCENQHYYSSEPARWTIVVKDCTETCKHKTRDVPEDVYYTLKVGQHYDSEDY